MKKIIASTVFMVFMLGAAGNVSAFWGSNNNWECMGPFGEIPGCNPYDEWDPRYWMEEMEDMWDDNDDYYYRGGYGGYPPPYGYGGYGGYAPPPYYGGGYMQQPYYPYPAPAAPPVAAPPAE